MDHYHHLNNRQQTTGNNNVEDLTHRLDQMNVGMQQQQYLGSNQVSQQQQQQQHSAESPKDHHPPIGQQDDQRMSIDEENIQPYDEEDDDDETLSNKQPGTGFHNHSSNNNISQDTSGAQDETQILIVTRLDQRVFTDPSPMRDKFESLVRQYDGQVTFRYLKSFRRVRLDFTSSKRAEQARVNLNNQQLGNSLFRCYPAQIIRPNFQQNSNVSDLIDHDPRIQHQHQQPQTINQDGSTSLQTPGYLNIPKLTRQHLISPPMSPPVDWEPKEESTPCIDVQLLSAIANLVPGQTHEIHAGNESQPGIFVEVCEEPHFETISQLSCRQRLPKTMIPGTPRPEPSNESHGGAGGVNTDICKMES